MSPSLKSLLKSAALVLAGAGVVGVGYVSMEQVLRLDAFAKFHSSGVPLGAEVGVTLDDVHMNAYEGGRLAASAEVASVVVRRDRSQLALTNVTQGEFRPADGDPFAFDMGKATYFYFQNRLSADTGAHVKNQDMDLVSDRFLYDEADKTLLVRGSVRGLLGGGKVEAVDVSVNTQTKALAATGATWEGKVDDLAQEGQRSAWKFDLGNMTTSTDGKTYIWTPGGATDGEVIVKADRVEYTKETDTLVAKGSVKYYGVDANMLCDEATVYRRERRAVFTGVVRMVIKANDDEKVVVGDFPTIERVTADSLQTNPQGATKEQVDVLRDTDNVRKYPTKVIADRIEYWYRKGERRAVITGSPFARQDLDTGWRLGWSVEAFYDGEKETLTLQSAGGSRDVKLFYSIGDQYVASTITLSTREGDKAMSGKEISGTVFVDEDEVPKRTGGGSTGGGSG